MIQRFKGLIFHPLFSGSAVMIVGSNLANFISYIYHLIIGRALGPVSYGELAAVLSLFGLLTAAFSFLGLVIVKFVSAAKRKEIQPLFSWFTKKALIFGMGIGGLVVLATPFLSNFLHIHYSILILVGPMLLFSVLGLLYASFLQGLLRFKEVVIGVNTNMVGRLVFGLVAIYLGFSVFGTVFGLLLASTASFLLLRFFLREYSIFDKAEVFTLGKTVLSYAVPIFLASFARNSIFSIDVVLVKHFFEPRDAGIYAALSTLGKIIFYGASPVASAMFPMVSKRHSKGKGYRKIFIMSLLLTSAIAGGVIFIYWVAPAISIKILYGVKFLEAAPHLVWFGLFMGIFTLSSLIVNFFLSRERTKVVFLVVAAALIQAVGIWFFHETISTVIRVSTISVSLLLASLLIYFGYDSRKLKLSG